MPYDPYAIMNPPEKNIRGDSVNGATGSKTSESLRNAALNRNRRPAGNVFTAMVDRSPSPSPLTKRRPTAIPGARSLPGAGIQAPVPDLRRSVTYFDPKTGGTTTRNPNSGLPNQFPVQPASIPGAVGGGNSPSGGFGTGGYSAVNPIPGSGNTYFDWRTGGTTHTNPGANPFANPTSDPSWGAPTVPPGSTTPFYGPRPGGGRYEDGAPLGGIPNQYPVQPAAIQAYSPFANPTPDTNPYDEVRRTLQKPDTNASAPSLPQSDIRRMLQKPGTGMSVVPDSGYQNMREDAPPDQFGPNPYAPQPQPSPQPNRPPTTPSTQPVPSPRPPTTPSTQPVNGPMVGQPVNNPWEGPPAPPGSTTPFYGPKPGGGRYEDGPMVGQPDNPDFGYGPGVVPRFAPPGTTPNSGLPNQFPVQPASIPGTVGARTPTGMTSPQGGPQYTPTGQLLGTNGIGRRYAGGDVPADEQGASGERAKHYEWGQDANGKRVLVETDAAGNPIQQPAPPQATPPAVGAPTPGTPPPAAVPGVPPATPPNGTGPLPATPPAGAEVGPTVSLPAATDTLKSTIASVREQFDPMFNDQQDDLRRQLMHVGSLTGATNSGGFVGSVGEEMRKLTNEQGGVLGSEISKQMLNSSQLGMQKYITDLNAVLDREKVKTNADLERAAQGLQRYGIDQNVLLDKYKAELALKGQTYSADAGVNAAALHAAASQAAAQSQSDASRYAADRGFESDVMGNQLRWGLGAMDDQTRRYLGDQNYNLGLYGNDVSRESNIMRYLSDMWQLSPEYLRLILGGDPSNLFPGMTPGDTVIVN